MKRDGRFIPAGAGNTSGAACAVLSASVHPRWRGEHAYRQVQGNEDAGSSPLARGTHLQLSLGNLQIRFIPAGAGNTKNISHSIRSTTVHPRWRGEHIGHDARRPFRAGSSPLARGTRVILFPVPAQVRFIPAGAGNTRYAGRLLVNLPVHPRWRGEHTYSCGRSSFIRGSSPLARGTPIAAGRQLAPSRFIPAGAGNTSANSSSPDSTTVHPRWRGEHISSGAPEKVADGSSPLARGTQRVPGWLVADGRFIPAGAGNTHE